MNRKVLRFALACLLAAGTGMAIACEYKPGETTFLEYAQCRYGEDSIQTVSLPEDFAWQTCIYYLEAFRPPKLLAVTKVQDGKEVVSVNDRHQIGNPCYLTKQYCDKALRDAQ